MTPNKTVTFRRLFFWLALLCLPAAAQAQSFPKLTGRVVDGANLLDPAQEQALDQKLAALEQGTGRQLAVVTLPDLQGYDISDYGYRLGRNWGIGTKEKNDGALLIIAPKERKVRIEVGYGLEGILTDAMSSLIINDAIVPRFKAGDFPGGIAAGVEEISALLKLPPDEARAHAAALAAKAKQGGKGSDIGGAIFVLLFVLFFIVLPMARRTRGGRRFAGGALPVMLWGPGLGGGRSDWGSDGGWGSGGGWGGGGGFSGGGGSFGGGGASGSW
ncbi:MAG TPA: TPM domain-containing protein [Candidatus Polarisedimenticolia bacterium]|nr:TPM domain-containing protein [Candidatus Polarisedimenticolia bacterium]